MCDGYLRMEKTHDKPTIFFSNPKVSSANLLQPHLNNTVERIKAAQVDYILSIQDSMFLNYTSHKAKTEIGRIGRTGKTDQYGLIQHNTLCVTNKNEPLGLIDLQHFHHDEFDAQVRREHRAIENKCDRCWISASQRRRDLLKGIDKKVITVADREGDFFEFLFDLYENQESFVIRAQHNRITGTKRRKKGNDKLFDLINREEDIGTQVTTIHDVETRAIKEIELKIKTLPKIYFPVPRYPSKQDKSYHAISVNVVVAYNDDYCWVLLTDLPVSTLEECQQVITMYRARWHIEDYHKILKTGYQVDELYLHASRKAIENALVMAAVSACRLYWMIYVGRVEGTVKADRLFKDYEWKALYVYFKEKVPEDAPCLNTVILKIARLGGYKPHNKASPPGIKTMWIGFQSFTIAAQMYHNLSTKT